MGKLHNIIPPAVLQNVVGVRVQADPNYIPDAIEDLALEVLEDESGRPISAESFGILNLKTGLMEFSNEGFVRDEEDAIRILQGRQEKIKYLGTLKALEDTVESLHHKKEDIRREMVRELVTINTKSRQLLTMVRGGKGNLNEISHDLNHAMDMYMSWKDELGHAKSFKAQVPYDDFHADDWWDTEGSFAIITDPHLTPTDKPTHIVFFYVEIDPDE